MRRLTTAILIMVMMVVAGGAPHAQTVPLTGKLVSASVTFTSAPANHFSAVVSKIPATGSFVLTQFCSTNGGNEIVSDNTFGFIAVGSDIGCASFSPGVALGKNSQIFCSGQPPFGVPASISCSISGVLGP